MSFALSRLLCLRSFVFAFLLACLAFVCQAAEHSMHDTKRIQGLVRTLRTVKLAGEAFIDASGKPTQFPLTASYVEVVNAFQKNMDALRTWKEQHAQELKDLSCEHYDQTLAGLTADLDVEKTIVQAWGRRVVGKVEEAEKLLPASTLLESAALFTDAAQLQAVANARDGLLGAGIPAAITEMQGALKMYTGSLQVDGACKLNTLRVYMRKVICVEWAVSQIVAFKPADAEGMKGFVELINAQMKKKGEGEIFHAPKSLNEALPRITAKAKICEEVADPVLTS